MDENSKHEFERLIQEDRENRESKHWSGTFIDYLEEVRQDPSIVKHAHARIYDMIVQEGATDINETDDPRVSPGPVESGAGSASSSPSPASESFNPPP